MKVAEIGFVVAVALAACSGPQSREREAESAPGDVAAEEIWRVTTAQIDWLVAGDAVTDARVHYEIETAEHGDLRTFVVRKVGIDGEALAANERLASTPVSARNSVYEEWRAYGVELYSFDVDLEGDDASEQLRFEIWTDGEELVGYWESLDPADCGEVLADDPLVCERLVAGPLTGSIGRGDMQDFAGLDQLWCPTHCDVFDRCGGMGPGDCHGALECLGDCETRAEEEGGIPRGAP